MCKFPTRSQFHSLNHPNSLLLNNRLRKPYNNRRKRMFFQQQATVNQSVPAACSLMRTLTRPSKIPHMRSMVRSSRSIAIHRPSYRVPHHSLSDRPTSPKPQRSRCLRPSLTFRRTQLSKGRSHSNSRGRRGIFQSRSPKSWRIYRNMLMKSRYRFSAQMMETFLTMSSPWPAYWANSARVAWAS